MAENETRGLVLALGAGGARGLAHIGVLEVLAEQGLRVRAIAGSSMGAQIGAIYACHRDVSRLSEAALGVDWKQTLQLFLPDAANGGVCSGRNIVTFLEQHLGSTNIEDLAIEFLAIATDLQSGEEVVLRRGSAVNAVRASLSLPGLLAPHPWEGRLLIDGGVVNPVPFDVAAESFGDPVVAVAVHQGARSLSVDEMTPHATVWRAQLRHLLDQNWVRRAKPIRTWLEEQLAEPTIAPGAHWRTRSVLTQAINIGQAQVVRLRLLTRQPAIYLTPDVEAIGPFEFYKARTAIAAGRAAARERLADLHALARVQGPRQVLDSSSLAPN